MREEKNINFHFYSGHIIAKQVVHKTWRLRHNFAIIISRLPILFKWTLGFKAGATRRSRLALEE